jgi:predicted Zn-dependent protease
VDRMKSSMTGLTRDGTFRIEGGEIAGPVRNLRLNDELRRMFKEVVATGEPDRYYDWLCPSALVPDVSFTSSTEST